MLNSTFHHKVKPDVINVTQIGKSSILKLENVPLKQPLVTHRHTTLVSESLPHSAEALDSSQELGCLFNLFIFSHPLHTLYFVNLVHAANRSFLFDVYH